MGECFLYARGIGTSIIKRQEQTGGEVDIIHMKELAAPRPELLRKVVEPLIHRDGNRRHERSGRKHLGVIARCSQQRKRPQSLGDNVSVVVVRQHEGDVSPP